MIIMEASYCSQVHELFMRYNELGGIAKYPTNMKTVSSTTGPDKVGWPNWHEVNFRPIPPTWCIDCPLWDPLSQPRL